MLTTDKWLSAEELEEKGGIKAQHAVYRALREHLARVNTGWYVEETAPGSLEDRQGIDIYLINFSTGERRILDVGMRPKEGSAFLVRVYRDWFETNADESWSLRKEKLNALLRAILPTLTAPSINGR